MAWDLVCHFGFDTLFLPPQVDSIKAGAPPPPLLRTQLEELTMFSEAHARSSIVKIRCFNLLNNCRNVIETTRGPGQGGVEV